MAKLSFLVLILSQSFAYAQVETQDREPAAVQIREAEIRNIVRTRAYMGGADEGNLSVQDKVIEPTPEKTIKELQAEYMDE